MRNVGTFCLSTFCARTSIILHYFGLKSTRLRQGIHLLVRICNQPIESFQGCRKTRCHSFVSPYALLSHILLLGKSASFFKFSCFKYPIGPISFNALHTRSFLAAECKRPPATACVLSIVSRAIAKSLHALWPIRTPRPAYTNRNATSQLHQSGRVS